MDMKRTSKVDSSMDQRGIAIARPGTCSGGVLRKQRDDLFTGAKDSRIGDRVLSNKENRGNHSVDGKKRNFTANLTRIQESTSNSSFINRPSCRFASAEDKGQVNSSHVMKMESTKRLREENHTESDRPNKYQKVSEKSAISLGGASGVRVSTDQRILHGPRKPISVVSKASFKNSRILPKKRVEDLQDDGDYFCRRKYSRTSLNKIFHPKVEVNKPPVSDPSTREESGAASKSLGTSVIASGEEKESLRNNQVSNDTGGKHKEEEERSEDSPGSGRSQISSDLMSDAIVDKGQVKVTSIVDRGSAKSLKEKDNLRLDHRNKDQKLNERRLVSPSKDYFQKPAEKKLAKRMFSTIKKPSINYQVIPSRRHLPMVIEQRTTTRARRNLLRKFSDTVAPKATQSAAPKRRGQEVNLILKKYEEFKRTYYGELGLPKGSTNEMDDHQTSMEVSWLPDISSSEDEGEESNGLSSLGQVQYTVKDKSEDICKERDMLYDWTALIAKSGSCERRRDVPTEEKHFIAERTMEELRHIPAKQERNAKRRSESDQEYNTKNSNEGWKSERRHQMKKESRTKETRQTSDKRTSSMEKRNKADEKLGVNDNPLREHKGIAAQQFEGLNLSWLPEILSSADEEEEKHCLDLLKQAPSNIEEAKPSFRKENRTDGMETDNVTTSIALEIKVDPPKPKEDMKQSKNELVKTIQPSTDKSTPVPKTEKAPKKDRPWWRSLFYSDDESSEGEDYNIGPQKKPLEGLINVNDATKRTDMQSDWDGLVGTATRPTTSFGRQEKSSFREESRRSSKGQSRKSSRRDKSKYDKRREASSKV